ncbi:GNAT family N-acetyltransferase [Altererythrobacter sp. KTW20L]|uniref:GNAT family N-acetyltransferase n=1 Tax=Altererythrobacter sp. KTW20L TaxID=2942210 RepID=UPI0020C17185|nr:GNAT family N-acetyltransferase [Altererythrobacter sp. KTW20L]MCL6250377.1 GNAT family N-acetyltransferase [Altererythrobacter sp. KTW20L]
MDRQPVLIGERLVLRPLRDDDWQALYAVASDPQLWARHPMHDRWQEPVFRAFFADALAQGGALVVTERSTGAVIGSSRFQGHDPADGGSVEIGWTFLARQHWGSGLNAEMKRLMLVHAFRFVERVLFRVGEDNVISRRAMEKIGGRLLDEEERIATDRGEIVHVVYEIHRALFAAGPLARP